MTLSSPKAVRQTTEKRLNADVWMSWLPSICQHLQAIWVTDVATIDEYKQWDTGPAQVSRHPNITPPACQGLEFYDTTQTCPSSGFFSCAPLMQSTLYTAGQFLHTIIFFILYSTQLVVAKVCSPLWSHYKNHWRRLAVMRKGSVHSNTTLQCLNFYFDKLLSFRLPWLWKGLIW